MDVVIESGKKRIFASVLDWPGWSRSARTEADALTALADYRERYGLVAARAGLALPHGDEFTVVERLPGDATTDFGAPRAIAERDYLPLTPPEAGRLAELLQATWAFFDDVVAGAPQSLRKGPRGGGRDRDVVVAHVVDAERSYARKIGVSEADNVARRALVVAAVRGAADGEREEQRWPIPYFVRRVAWHVLDHAWEIEDRSER